jgi:hypothetical protein
MADHNGKKCRGNQMRSAMIQGHDRIPRQASPARDSRRRFIERHHRSILVGWTLLLLCLLLIAAEIFLRYTIPYRIDYYTGVKLSNRLVKYPFGDMPFNSYGYPDREWDKKDPRPRVGFLGDSVTMGFGAGFGYRYSDVISDARKDKYYMNFGGAGEDGVASDEVLENIIVIAQRFRLKKLVYGMNLNDILPSLATGDVPDTPMRTAKSLVWKHFDALRSRSYVYNYFRTKAKIAASRLGYGYHGDEAFELHPMRNSVVVGQTVDRINKLWLRLKQQDIEFCVVLFPYEMQISTDAAVKYRQYGIQWSSELLRGEPQSMILRRLAPDIVAVDLAQAFNSNGLKPADIQIGQYFVYNKGDALDWNHPNRNGHKLVAEYLIAQAAQCI